MIGFRVEPGERTAAVMSTAPKRASSRQAGRADLGDHLAGAVVDNDHRRRQAPPERCRVVAHKLLEVGLRRGSRASGDAPCGSCAARPRCRPDAAPAWGTRGARVGTRSRHGTCGVVAEMTPAAQHAREHVVAGALGGLREAVRAAELGRLRNGDQQGGFANRQPPRLLAEIGERGGAHAFQVAAEGRQPQVEAQDLVLGQLPLELQRQQRLPDLAGTASARARRAAGAPPAW